MTSSIRALHWLSDPGDPPPASTVCSRGPRVAASPTHGRPYSAHPPNATEVSAFDRNPNEALAEAPHVRIGPLGAYNAYAQAITPAPGRASKRSSRKHVQPNR